MNIPWKIWKYTPNQIIALVIWLCGTWLTSLALGQMGVPDPANIIAAFAMQLALTKAESPIWKGKERPWVSIGALAIDVSVNSGGVWPYMKNFGNTDTWAMIRDIMGNPEAKPTVWTVATITIGIGTLTAAAAEYFWNL